MTPTNEQQFQLQFATITSSLYTVAQTMSNLEHQIVNTPGQRALLAQSQEGSLTRNLSNIYTDIIKLQTNLLFETDSHQRELISVLLKNAQDQQKQLQEAIENYNHEFLTIVGRNGQIHLPQPTATALATPAVETIPQESPSSSLDYRPQTPSIWSNKWSNKWSVIERQSSTKKFQTQEEPPSLPQILR